MVLCQRATSMDYRKKSEEWVYVLLSLSDMHRYSLLVDVLGLYLTCEIESWFYLLTIFLISIFTGTFAHCRFIWGYWKWSGRFLVQRQMKKNNFTRRKSGYKLTHHSQPLWWFSLLSTIQGVKLRLIQAPMSPNFSLWWPNPES